MNIFRKRTRRKETIDGLGEFIFSSKGDKSSASARIKDDLGTYRLRFKVYDNAVTPYQINLYKQITANWKNMASGINKMQGTNDSIPLTELIIRDINDRSTNIICEIYTETVVLEMERDNELLKDLIKQ